MLRDLLLAPCKILRCSGDMENWHVNNIVNNKSKAYVNESNACT